MFGKTPQEKEMQRLIHDTNSQIDRLNLYTKKMAEWLKQNAKPISDIGINTSVPFVIVEYLKSIKKELTQSLDEYYKKFSNDFPEENQIQKEESK